MTATAATRPNLIRHADFRKLWVAESVRSLREMPLSTEDD